jgi:hypothetical protein
LAEAFLENDRAYLEPPRQPPNAIEVKRLYGDLWGKTGPLNTPIPKNGAAELSLTDHFTPITAGEVGERISKVRKKAAAGPHGLHRDHLLIPGLPTIIAKIFNICWYCSYFPTVWKENRTTLIPKPNKPSSLVENWRPIITIGPTLGRIFSAILDGKIRKDIVLSLKQKGFASENGCKINIDLPSAGLDYSERNNGGYSRLWISPKHLIQYLIRR